MAEILKTMPDKVKNEVARYINFIFSFKEVRKIYLFGSYAYGTPDEESDIVIVDWDSTFEADTQKATLQREVETKGILLYDDLGYLVQRGIA
ncbi:MAG: nucleotidyltransferase domain-containing protein [Oscillospiraceae bacterium]|nr:nucleotidyltransferase domain-containing protein [Oscillospiraceae bacterium]